MIALPNIPSAFLIVRTKSIAVRKTMLRGAGKIQILVNSGDFSYKDPINSTEIHQWPWIVFQFVLFYQSELQVRESILCFPFIYNFSPNSAPLKLYFNKVLFHFVILCQDYLEDLATVCEATLSRYQIFWCCFLYRKRIHPKSINIEKSQLYQF